MTPPQGGNEKSAASLRTVRHPALDPFPVAILAGGMATRLRPLTEKIPKALLPVAGKPFLAHQLELLRAQGIARVVLCLGYLGENIEREVLEATALEGYREGKLSHAQVGRMLALSRFEVDEFLKAHDVPADYSIADLEQDRRTLDKLFTK